MSARQVSSRVHDGIAVMARHHRSLRVHYSQAEALIASDAEDFVALEAVLDGLIQYSISCFELEEALMKLVQYPRIDEHLKSHDMFMRRLSGYRGRLEAGKYTATELMSLLRIWMVGHVEEQDRHLIGALQGIAAKAR